MQSYSVERDLDILTAMADQMAPYLVDSLLLWPLSGNLRGGMPQLTLGGYLLRKHRVHSLQDTLTDAQQAVFTAAVDRVEALRREWSVHDREKMAHEWNMRLNLLNEFLRDCEEKNLATCVENWPNQAKQRTMLHHLFEELDGQQALTDDQRRGLQRIDRHLRRYLSHGETGIFLLADELQVVYPREQFWWLWVTPQDEGLPG